MGVYGDYIGIMEKKLEVTNLGFRVWRLGGVGSWDLGFGDLGFWGSAFWGEGCRDPRKVVLTILQETLGILVHDSCNCFCPGIPQIIRGCRKV